MDVVQGSYFEKHHWVRWRHLLRILCGVMLEIFQNDKLGGVSFQRPISKLMFSLAEIIRAGQGLLSSIRKDRRGTKGVAGKSQQNSRIHSK
jgi:hypothetical protein